MLSSSPEVWLQGQERTSAWWRMLCKTLWALLQPYPQHRSPSGKTLPSAWHCLLFFKSANSLMKTWKDGEKTGDISNWLFKLRAFSQHFSLGGVWVSIVSFVSCQIPSTLYLSHAKDKGCSWKCGFQPSFSEWQPLGGQTSTSPPNPSFWWERG